MSWARKGVVAALVASVLVAATLASASDGSAGRAAKPTCTYDAATKVVTFAFVGDAYGETFDLFQPHLERSGDRLVFKSAYNRTLACAGGIPTVDNTDRIDLTSTGPKVSVLLTLDLAKGPLAPGATPEASKPEIEIESTIPGLKIEITPSDKQEDYTFGQTAEGPAANLNADEPSADLDIVLHDLEPPRRHDDFTFAISEYTDESNAGNDVYSAAGGEGFTGPFPYNVLFVGGTGKDRLTGSLSNDTIYGGEDKDVLAGGKGNDRINALGAQRDRVDCGPGKDLAEATDRDIVKNCERIADDNFKLGTDLQPCGKVNDEGGRSPVKTFEVSCNRAREIARDFIQDDVRRQGWRTYNPAGCEWFMYRKSDRDEFLDWQQGSGPLSFPVVYFIKMRDCVS